MRGGAGRESKKARGKREREREREREWERERERLIVTQKTHAKIHAIPHASYIKYLHVCLECEICI